MKYLIALFCLMALAVNGAEIVKLDYPAQVRAGEELKLVIHTKGAPGETVVYEFNGETRTAPPDMIYYPAADYKTQYSKVDGGAITSASKYHTLCTMPFPQDQNKYTVWVRYSDGPVCLRRSEKELKWSWKAPAKMEWVNLGSYDAATVGPALSVMGSPKEPFARVEAVMLTTADAKAFTPGAYPPNIFSWKPGQSAIGKHELKIKVNSAEQTIKFEVTGAAGTAGKQFTIPADRQLPLEPAKLNTDPANYPLFNFFNDSYRKQLAANPFRLKFNDKFMLPLKSNEYQKLADTVEFDIGKKVAGLAFLLTEYWQGEVNQEMAHFVVKYEDGTSVRISLREEVEVCGSLRNRNPQGAIFAGIVNSESIEYHLTILPWVNPSPEKTIKSLVFSNVRTVFSEAENKIIPLNVSEVSSQILLSLVGLTDKADVAALAAAMKRGSGQNTATADITIDYGRAGGKIHPAVFSTNETGVMTANDVDFDHYLKQMKEINCKNFRFHSGWNLEMVYPNKLDKPNYEPLVKTIRKLYATNPEWQVMICFNSIPKYLDPKTAEGRKLFATLCADLLRELNIKRKLNVKYWEIYNEVYFKKIDEDRALWHMYNEAAEAMRQVDPSIKIGGYAPCWPVLGNIRDFYRHCHKNTDFISYHKYLTGSAATATDYIMKQTNSFAEDARKIRQIAAEITPGKPIELALTEYNINFNWQPHDPRQATYVGAAWLASVLNHLIRADVEIAQTWHSRSGGTFGLISREGEIRPMGKLLAVCNNYISGDYVWTQSSNADIECLGFRNDKNAGFLLVNKSDKTTPVTISVLNPPTFKENFIVPAGQAFAITEAGFNVSQSAFPQELKLAPYETLVIVNPLN